MGCFKTLFPRIQDILWYEERGKRLIILKMVVALFNVRARRVGISQIKNTYLSRLDVDVNEVI